jgi:dTDP-glucose pyrophosphorylase
MQLIIPMAGLGSRFTKAGYTTPKPLLQIHGQEMFKVVLSNMHTRSLSRIVLVTPTSFGMAKKQRELTASLGIEVNILEVDYTTDGPASTIALCEEFLDPASPLVTANSDQYLNFEADSYYSKVESGSNVGVILTMQDSDPKWSYVRMSDDGGVVDIKEKTVISTFATVGVYGFQRAEDAFEAIREMKRQDDKTNGEFYLAPAYPYMRGFYDPGVGIMDLGPVGKVMFGLGTPQDFESFLQNPVSKVASDRAREIFG